jgi:hypothetical protein
MKTITADQAIAQITGEEGDFHASFASMALDSAPFTEDVSSTPAG